MPRYRVEIDFDAENDEEAKRYVRTPVAVANLAELPKVHNLEIHEVWRVKPSFEFEHRLDLNDAV